MEEIILTHTYQFFHQNLQLSRLFKKRINEQLTQVDLFQAQWSIVYYLKNFGSSTLVEISNYFDVEKPTITRTVNRLEEHHLIEQIPGKDKRERRIQLTENGMKVYERASKVVGEFEQDLLDDISESDLEVTLKTLAKLTAKLSK